MKSNYLFYILFLVSGVGFAQCIGTFQFPSSATVSLNDGSVQQITDCNFGGDFTNINGLTVGGDYKFSSSIVTDYITLTDGSDNVIASGLVPLVVNAIEFSDIKFNIHSSASCGEQSSCRITTIQCTSCTPAPAPDCATNPNPVDGALNVPFGNVTFSWDAPTTGPTPTSYHIYAGESPTGDDFVIIATVATTSVLLNIGDYDFQYYWMVKPVNSSTEAVGCAIWTFTSEMVPDPPVNDNVCDAIPLTLENPSSGGAYSNISATIQTGESGGSCWFIGDPASESVWFTFVAPTSGEVRITTVYNDGSLNDIQMTLYSLTDCSDFSTFTELACDEDDDANVDPNAGVRSLIEYTALTPGNTYYIQVDGYSNNVGTFDIGVFDLNLLSITDVESNLSFTYFPNPVQNELILKAQSNIQDVTIYNMLGQEVLRTAPNALESNVNMAELQTGAYFVKVSINDAVETIRIIKQ